MNRQHIGCCGLSCETCNARIATLSGDAALRERTAALWSELNGVTITTEEICCTGCRTEGAKTPFCADFCQIRRCVRERRLDTCAGCAALPGCETLARITVNTPAALENLKALRAEGEARVSDLRAAGIE